MLAKALETLAQHGILEESKKRKKGHPVSDDVSKWMRSDIVGNLPLGLLTGLHISPIAVPGGWLLRSQRSGAEERPDTGTACERGPAK